MLTRQQKRKAERRLKQDRFPWPEKHGWIRRYLSDNPEYFAQTQEDNVTILSNLEGEVKTYTIEEFYILLRKLMSENSEGD